MRIVRCRLAVLGLLASLVGWPGSSNAAPNVHVSEKESVHIRFRCLTATPVDAPEGGAFLLELDPHSGGNTQFELLWPDSTTTTTVTVIGSALPPRSGEETVIRLEAKLTLPDGSRHEASRDLAFTHKTTALFELARDGTRPLTLAVEAESVREMIFATHRTVGPPVVMNLEVEWLEDGTATPLETDRLSTFVGEWVSYSFRLDRAGDAKELEIRLIPEKIFGDVLQVRAEVTGSIAGEESVQLLSRSEQWMISRGQSSSLDVATGKPPKGFRFVVTPRF